MRIDRRVLAGGAFLVGFVAILYGVTHYLPVDSIPRIALWDVGLPVIEITALVLIILALRRNAAGPYRCTWVLLALWIVSNLFADIAWGWYELVLRSPLPSPSTADIGYLASYPLAFLTVVLATWRASGTLRTLESSLDALMLTLGLAGLCWPFLFAPLLNASPGTAGLVSLAYPIGDLLVIVAFSSLLLSSYHQRPPRFMMIIWAAFVVQVIADSVYFVEVASATAYTSGGWLDAMWALVFALAGAAALEGIFAPETNVREERLTLFGRPRRRVLTYPRMLIPYLAVPVAGALIWVQFATFGAVWNADMQVLIYVGIGLVALLVSRQFVTLFDNRTLYTNLSKVSAELRSRVEALGDLTARLDELNTGSVGLNGLRSLSEIIQKGLELACSVTKASAGWVTINKDDGTEPVEAVFGDDDLLPAVGDTRAQNDERPAEQPVEEVALEARGERIGSLWLTRTAGDGEGPDLVQAVGAHLATAIDNTRRYEEVLRLAERDPLTGLYNHRGIHQRLAIEGRRAQQRGGRLSLVMIDLDDFKLLNDTYGHPAGDRVLTVVGDTIRSVLRHTDLAGRVGGDEMMLVLPDTDREGAMQLAQRLRDALSAKPFVAGKDRSIPLRLSLGVATYPNDADTLTGLVGVADANLYASKQRGGDTVTEPGTTEEPPPEAGGLRGIAYKLMDVVGARDHYTRRHSDQVALHALRLGQTLGLSEQSLETLKLASMLHDVGKIGLGPQVLRKPGPLTLDEERSLRSHVDMGEAIIRDLPRVAEVLEAVHSHHERYDGTGYPAGLFGEDIPLLARILSVADAYAAMTVDRPFRVKLTAAQARQELEKVAGTQLDPELVNTFVQVLETDPKDRFAAAS